MGTSDAELAPRCLRGSNSSFAFWVVALGATLAKLVFLHGDGDPEARATCQPGRQPIHLVVIEDDLALLLQEQDQCQTKVNT